MLQRTMLAAMLAALALSGHAADAQQVTEQVKEQAKEQIKTQEQTKAQTKEQARTQTREQVYGSQLMTPQERRAYRQKMRRAESEEERNQIRLEHHKQMQERAKERGVTLPDEPPPRGGGMGPGGGMGRGMR